MPDRTTLAYLRVVIAIIILVLTIVVVSIGSPLSRSRRGKIS